MTRRTALLAGAAGLSMTGLSGCVSISRDSRRRTEVVHEDSSELAGVSIQTTDGDIVLKDATDDQVTIRAVKHARGDVAFEDLTLETSHEGDHLTVETRIEDESLFNNGWIDLRISVPEDVVVDRVESTDGSIALERVTGDSRVRTNDGDVAVTYADGDLDIRVEDGDITVRETEGLVSATVTDGDITVHDPGSVGTLDVVDGDIIASIPAAGHDATISATDGDITARLGDDLDARIVARTTDGEIAGVDTLEKLETVSETYLAGLVGNGTNTISMEATDGDVTVR